MMATIMIMIMMKSIKNDYMKGQPWRWWQKWWCPEEKKWKMHEIGEEMTWVDGRGRGRDEIAKFLSPIPYRRGNQPSAQLEKVILFREGIERERESERE